MLTNILGQNPNFHVSSTSGILDIIMNVRNMWQKLPEFKATPNEAGKIRVLKGILNNYYGDVEKPIVFDKSRGWVAQLEFVENLLGRKAKILVPVRDITEILTSFEMIWRRDSKTRQVPQEAKHFIDFQTIRGRCSVWMKPEQPVGIAYNRVRDALHRGFADRMHFVEYDDLTNFPKQTMDSIYKFLEEEPFEHDFADVKQITHEDDTQFGFSELHTIRSKVEPKPKMALSVLGTDVCNLYRNCEFWRKKQDGN